MKTVVRVVLVMGIISFLFACSGCKNQSNIKDSAKFSSFSQKERQDYICDYLQKNYGLICNVSEVKQRQISVVKNEDDYFATARTEDDRSISVWVTKDGKVTDSVFLLDMSTRISSYFDGIISNVFSDYKSRVYTELYDKPKKIWNADDDVVSFLESEPTSTYIRLFVNKNDSISNEKIDQLKSLFCQCNIKIYVYYCEELDKLNVDEYDLTTFDISSEKKGNK